MSQGQTEPGHPNIQEYEDDEALLIKKEQVNENPVRKYHYSVKESNNYDSSDSSVDSGIGRKDENQCLSEKDMTNENSSLTKCLSTERGIRKPMSQGDTGTIIKRGCDKICKKLNLSRMFLSISVVSNIVLVVVVILLATRLGVITEPENVKCPLQQLLKDSVQESLCIPCDYIGSRVKTEDTLFNTIYSCGKKICCVRNAALQKLVLLMIQDGSTKEVTNERLTSQNHGDFNKSLVIWRSRPIAAHLYANVTSLPEKITWQNEDGFGLAFMRGVTLTPESRLEVPEAGFYFIYSAVTFQCQLGSRPLIQMINRQHRGRPNAGVQQLLLSKTSECGPGGFYTSFLAGVVKLNSNDELSVYLTDTSLQCVYRVKLSNYFGLYLL
ncbi:hypothetical protein ACJMK2_009470 [Sinanodonta woodiana]|uniref:THD domain-containing protein n=1 Tax=Sinanodonta woodiana TaxID=1069815 RepID=A0ABD3VFA2_SINWO